MEHLHALLWMDFETTGLLNEDPYLLEVGWGLSDFDFRWLSHPTNAYPSIAKSLLPVDDLSGESLANDFVKQMHRESGLWTAREANPHTGINRIEDMILETIDRHVAKEGGSVTLTGSGVSTFDKVLIRGWMPALDQRITYYTIDIGNVERFFRLMTGEPLRSSSSQSKHRVIPDILEARDKAIDLMTRYGV